MSGGGHSHNQMNALEMSLQAASKPLTDFSRMVNPNIPAYREVEGSWLKDSDFYGCFEYIQIYYNPSKFSNSNQVVTQWDGDLENNASDNLEVLVCEEMKEMVNEGTEEEPNEQQFVSKNEIELVVGFNPLDTVEDLNLKPYLILQSYDFLNLTSVKNYESLKGPYESVYLKKPNEN